MWLNVFLFQINTNKSAKSQSDDELKALTRKVQQLTSQNTTINQLLNAQTEEFAELQTTLENERQRNKSVEVAAQPTQPSVTLPNEVKSKANSNEIQELRNEV